MKKYYNLYSNSVADKMLNLCIKQYFNNQYFYITSGVYRIGAEGNLVFGQRYLSYEKDDLDVRINNINELNQKNPNLKFYLYYFSVKFVCTYFNYYYIILLKVLKTVVLAERNDFNL